MKCSEARELALTQDLTVDQVEALRAHVRECSACAAELEGYLFASGLGDAPLERPSPSFADAVMARIETLPAPRKQSTEYTLAAASFIATVAGLAVFFSAVREWFLDEWLGKAVFAFPVGLLKDAVVYVAEKSDLFVTVTVELLKTTYGTTSANLSMAGIVLFGLLIMLCAARPRETAV